MQRTAVSTWFSPLTTMTAISGWRSAIRSKTSSPLRCGMVRSSRTRPVFPFSSMERTSRLSLQVVMLLIPPQVSRVSASEPSQAGSSSTRRTPKSG